MANDLQRAVASLRQEEREDDGDPSAMARQKAGPARALLIGYAIYMFVGFVLLSLDFSQEKPVAALDNLFIAVSAVSTTGLITVDPASSYTLVGEIVILCLIQAGGLGYMTIGSFLFLTVRENLSRSRDETARTEFSLPETVTAGFFIRSAVFFTFTCEIVGACLLYVFFIEAGADRPLWSAIFHAVSAFCTAGFSIYSDSFASFSGNFSINATIAALSILGAMGFIIVADTARRVIGRQRHYGYTSKIIVRLTAILILAGTALLFVAEDSIQQLPAADRLLAAFFQAMTASTTVGFNTIDIGNMANATLLVLMVLMVIGASPAGTGGGLKTTSLAALIAVMRSVFTGDSSIRIFGRRIPVLRVELATASFVAYLGFLVLAVFILCLSDTAPFEMIVFEAISAIGTVGLSMGLTSGLSDIGKWVIIGLMLVGRLGVLTFGFAIARHADADESARDGDADGENELAM